eukprot:11158695-Lingulodinium_polyedra.AAC.1
MLGRRPRRGVRKFDCCVPSRLGSATPNIELRGAGGWAIVSNQGLTILYFYCISGQSKLSR